MGSVDADGKLAKHLDDYVGGMIYSMVGTTSPEAQLQYQLELAHNSLRDLHRQLEELQHKSHALEYKYVKAKEEASLNALALKRRLGEYEALKEKYDQLSRECDLYRRDIEVFSEATEDAEERRDEAEKRAVEAEKRATDAQRKLEAALVFVEELMRDDAASERIPHAPSAEVKYETPTRSPASNKFVPGSTERIESPSFKRDPQSPGTSPSSRSPAERTSGAAVNQEKIGSGAVQREQESHSGRKVLAEANYKFADNTTVSRKRNFRREEGGNEAFLGRNESEKCKIVRSNSFETNEKENSIFGEMGARSIRQAAESDLDRLSLEIKHLIRLVKIGQNNLLKAELEADIIQARNWELQRLLLDVIVTFGIFPQRCFEKVAPNSPGARSPSKLPKSSSSAV